MYFLSFLGTLLDHVPSPFTSRWGHLTSSSNGMRQELTSGIYSPEKWLQLPPATGARVWRGDLYGESVYSILSRGPLRELWEAVPRLGADPGGCIQTAGLGKTVGESEQGWRGAVLRVGVGVRVSPFPLGAGGLPLAGETPTQSESAATTLSHSVPSGNSLPQGRRQPLWLFRQN